MEISAERGNSLNFERMKLGNGTLSPEKFPKYQELLGWIGADGMPLMPCLSVKLFDSMISVPVSQWNASTEGMYGTLHDNFIGNILVPC